MFQRGCCTIIGAKVKLTALATSLLLLGCAAPSPNYTPKVVEVSDPPIGAVVSVAVGDVMLRQGVFSEHAAIEVPQAIKAGLYTIQPGIYLKQGDTPEMELFYPGGANPGRVIQSALADNWSYVILKKTEPKSICVLTSYNTAITTCAQATGVVSKTVASTAKSGFQQALLYNGRVGSKINIAYREFSNDTARPAFNNAVEYDISDQKLIRYKGAQLEVIDATNQEIRFKVLRNFNAAIR